MAQFPASVVCFLILWLWLPRMSFLHAKECTNVPTEYFSHSLRARSIPQQQLHYASASLDNLGKTDVVTSVESSLHEAALSSFQELEQSSAEKLLPQLRRSFSEKSLQGDFSVGQNQDVKFRRSRSQNGAVKGILKEVSLHNVRLTPGSLQAVAQETNLQYLLMLDVDRMVWNFRKTAGLEAPGTPYGGWESPTSELRGHFVGHYLSAAALMWASTHNMALLAKLNTLVKALEECQTKLGTGYLSAFPSEFFDRFESIRPVWAPYYTIHKIMAGLLDQYTLIGNGHALDMLLAMTKYFNKRVEAVINQFTIERHWRSLNEETGGMNDVLYRLYRITGDKDHLKLAHLFDKPCFLGPLALQTDNLSGFHSNTHIPVVVGAQMRYEVTGDELYKTIADYFLKFVNSSHSYVTGGTSSSEFWTDPMRQGDTLRTENQEFCTTYNMLKITRNLFRWTKAVPYADYYERMVLNGVMGLQRGQQAGVMIYMLPLGPGTSKAKSFHGWGTKFDSFWCCYGSGIESFAKLGDSIYFEEDNMLALYVTQFVSSEFSWDEAGILLAQSVEPIRSEDPSIHVKFEILAHETTSKEAVVHIRIPSWTTASHGSASLNGKQLQIPPPGSFLTVVRKWAPGDIILLVLPMTLMLERIQDNRDKYSTLHAILFGPFVMAGLSSGDLRLGPVDNIVMLSKWITPIPSEYRTQLYSFRQTHVSGQESSLLCVCNMNGSAIMGPVPLEGTDEAGFSTFRLATPLVNDRLQESSNFRYKGNSSFQIDKKVVSFELFNEPGRYLAHNGENSIVTVVNQLSHAQTPDQRFTSGVHTSQPETVDEGMSDFQAADAVFIVCPGLTEEKYTVSFEAVSKPGCFLSSRNDGESEAIHVILRCKLTENDTGFDTMSTFTIEEGFASYHPVSFVARGGSRNFLLAPLSAYQDERYTTYFEIY